MAYIGRGHNNPIKVWESFLEGYQSIFHFKRERNQVAPYQMICLSSHMLINYQCALGEKTIFP